LGGRSEVGQERTALEYKRLPESVAVGLRDDVE